MYFRTVFLLALTLLLFRGVSVAQSSHVSDYIGAYYSDAHPRGGFSVQPNESGFTISFCKDMILNDCKHLNVQKSLGSTFEFQPSTDAHGGTQMSFTAKAVLQGTKTSIQVRLADGSVWEFSKR